MKKLCCTFLALSGLLVAAAQEFENVWSDAVYQIDTISFAKGPIATWIIFKGGKYDAGPKNATGVFKHYDKQTSARKQKGIFIHSHTYAVLDTPEAREWMTPYLRQLYDDKEWRTSEAKLVNDLKQECEKRQIALYVNTSVNLGGKWRLLTTTGTEQKE